MEKSDSTCFYDTWYARKEGKISESLALNNLLAHIYAGRRHEDDQHVNEGMISYWAERDIVSAAIMICMVEKDFQPPQGTEPIMSRLIIQCKSSSLDDLRQTEAGCDAVLDTPLLFQVLVAAAFQQGNRPLVRDMITSASPAPGSNLIFGMERNSGFAMDFGDGRGYGHGALQGQTDNGCDLWVDLIKTGWAVPRPYMQSWAASSTSAESGKRLLEILIQHEVDIDDSAVVMGLLSRKLDMLDYILHIHTPTDEPCRYNLLVMAAGFQSGGVECLELLFRHGIKDLNWRPAPEDDHYTMPIYREDKVPKRTPLHAAAERGDPAVVKWLIKHGAQPRPDYFGMTPYELAKSEGREEVAVVFKQFPGYGTNEGLCIAS